MTPPLCTIEPLTKPRLLELALAFNKISLASFGGGLSAWARRVIVEEKKWLDDEEFLSALTLSRVLPGANQMNFAIYVGNRFHGFEGAIAAVLGLITIPFLIILALAYAYFFHSTTPAIQDVLRGVSIAPPAIMSSMAYLRLSFVDPATSATNQIRGSRLWRKTSHPQDQIRPTLAVPRQHNHSGNWGYAGPAGRRGTARGMSSPTAAPGTIGRLQGFSAKLEETAVPTSLQYPLERERELQHRWNRLLQRSVAPKDHSSRSPLSSVVRSNLRNSPRPAATTHRPPLRA